MVNTLIVIAIFGGIWAAAYWFAILADRELRKGGK